MAHRALTSRYLTRGGPTVDASVEPRVEFPEIERTLVVYITTTLRLPSDSFRVPFLVRSRGTYPPSQPPPPAVLYGRPAWPNKSTLLRANTPLQAKPLADLGLLEGASQPFPGFHARLYPSVQVLGIT